MEKITRLSRGKVKKMKQKLDFFLPNLGIGGAENVAYQLGAALREYDSRYILMEDKVDYPVGSPLEFMHIDNSRKRNVMSKLYKFLRMYLQVRRFKRNGHLSEFHDAAKRYQCADARPGKSRHQCAKLRIKRAGREQLRGL